MTRIVILGGGPGGYEAALVAAQVGAEVTVVDRDGLGGACVLDDCVPSKTLIATSELMTMLEGSPSLGVTLGGPSGVGGRGGGHPRSERGAEPDPRLDGGPGGQARWARTDLARVNARVR
ncbi:MAG: FAD-dependent oxidoreductase, partial [Streptosporangiaceae bacterium]